ncbi:hypothetical protein ACFVAJ_18580 [Agromyces sp. NPDC057679]|uniref:hypothetical protein n=1 Tax=Agromyces sp. NPDC057679 TaxID=3346207 RepID=UPI003671E274
MNKRISAALGAAALVVALVAGAASPAMAAADYSGNRSCPGAATVVKINATVTGTNAVNTLLLWNSNLQTGTKSGSQVFYGPGYKGLTTASSNVRWEVTTVNGGGYSGTPYASCL